VVTTGRLVLVPLSHAMMTARLASDRFSLELDGLESVLFPPSWPGDALGMFAPFLAGDDPVGGTFVAIDR
jgi:hypothetical protein